MDGNYGNGYGYNGWQEPEKKESTAFGIASLVLGIVSLLLFCICVNWITAVLAIIFGIIQLVKHRQKGMAIGGIITAGLSMLFSLILYISIFISAAASDNYYDYYDYNDYYDNYDGYYDDYYYDEDYGNEYLDAGKIRDTDDSGQRVK